MIDKDPIDLGALFVLLMFFVPFLIYMCVLFWLMLDAPRAEYRYIPKQGEVVIYENHAK